jgi:hypothetical protein
MKRLRSSLPVTALACALLLGGQAAAVSFVSFDSPETCASVRAWAQPFAHTSPSLEEFSRLSRAKRKALFNAIRPEVRARLWRERLERAHASEVSLTPEQRALLKEASTFLSPALYSGERAEGQAFRAFWARAQASFPTAKEKGIWFDLAERADGPRPAATSVLQLLVRPFRAEAQDPPPCGCNMSYGNFDCLWMGGTCDGGGCDYQIFGCGPNWMAPCDRACQATS